MNKGLKRCFADSSRLEVFFKRNTDLMNKGLKPFLCPSSESWKPKKETLT